jgi:hypothetical protein
VQRLQQLRIDVAGLPASGAAHGGSRVAAGAVGSSVLSDSRCVGSVEDAGVWGVYGPAGNC